MGDFLALDKTLFSKVIKMKNNMTKKQIFEIIGVVALCALIVVGAVLGVLFGVNMPSPDIEAKQEEQQSPVVIETVQEQGITLMSSGATTASDGTTTKTITATVTPANVKPYLKLVWDLAFKNASSTWANGKVVTDYVDISISEDSFTCTVTCKQAFAEKVVINVQDNFKTAFASLNVDYLKRIVSYNVEIVNIDGGEKQVLDSSNEDEQIAGVMIASSTTRVPEYRINLYYTYSEGTLVGSEYFRWDSRDGSMLCYSGKEFHFDEQSDYEWSLDTYYISLYYNNSKVASWAIMLSSPASLSLSVSSITF